MAPQKAEAGCRSAGVSVSRIPKRSQLRPLSRRFQLWCQDFREACVSLFNRAASAILHQDALSLHGFRSGGSVILGLCVGLLIPTLSMPLTKTAAGSDRWAFQTWDSKGGQRLVTGCGSLQYFMDARPFEGSDTLKDEVTHQNVGVISGFAIHVVFHRIEYSDGGHPGLVKLILVERTPGEMCAILEDQDLFGEFRDLPSPFSVVIDSQEILGSQDAFWLFDKDGPIPIDLSPINDAVKEAARKLLPAGWEFGSGSEFDARTFTEKHRVRR